MSPTLFNTFFVPGYDYITIYPDALSPYRFYYFKSHPRLSSTKDPAKNVDLPNLRFTVYRNPLDHKQSQSGTLLFTADLGLTAKEEKDIRNVIWMHVLSSDYLADMKRYYPEAYERIRSDVLGNEEMALTVEHYRIAVNRKSITLSTLQPTDGNVELELVQLRDSDGDTGEKHFILYQTPKHKPNLNGNFSTSFSASFADLATEQMLNCLKKGYTITDGKQIPLTAIVRYDLTIPFLVPALEAEVSVDMKQVYRSLLDELHIPYTFTSDKLIIDQRYRYQEHRYSRGQINDTFKRLIRGNRRGINIDLMDYSALGAGASEDEVSQKIMNSLVDAVCGSLLTQMFTVNPEPPSSGQTASASGSGSDLKERNLKDVSYSIREFQRDWTDINFSLRKKQIINLTFPANGDLSAIVPTNLEDEIITEVDLSRLEMGRRQVQLSCQRNPNPSQIECVELLCRCDSDDVRFKNKFNEPKSFLFKNAEEPCYYKYYYAKKSDGSYETRFAYQTRIHFVGRPPSNWTPEVWVDTDNLMLSYENIGFLNVDLEVLDVDWQMVSKVFVDISYPAVKDKPDTARTLVFTDDTPQQWGCYKYGNKSNQYQYSIRFKDKDGFEYPEKPKLLMSTNDKLTISDLYGGQAMKATFRVSFVPEQVVMVGLTIHYIDEHLRIDRVFPYTFSSPGSYDWEMFLQEGACEKIHYVYEVVYRDSTTSIFEYDASGRHPDLRLFVVPQRMVSQPAPQVQNQDNILMIIADGLFADQKWTTAMVTVKYEDPENGIFLNKPVLLNRTKTNDTVSVTCPGNAFKPYLCSAILLDTSGHQTHVPETSCTGFFNIVPPTD